MASFDIAVETILKNEGLLSNDPADHGGATKYGISLKLLQDSGIDVNDDGKIDADDVRILNLEQAKDIYRTRFWVPLWNKVGQALGTKLLDVSVNMGIGAAVRMCQRALNDMGQYVSVDGVFGSVSLVACQQVDEQVLLAKIRHLQRERYEAIAEADPTQEKFLKGWLNRVDTC